MKKIEETDAMIGQCQGVLCSLNLTAMECALHKLVNKNWKYDENWQEQSRTEQNKTNANQTEPELIQMWMNCTILFGTIQTRTNKIELNYESNVAHTLSMNLNCELIVLFSFKPSSKTNQNKRT